MKSKRFQFALGITAVVVCALLLTLFPGVTSLVHQNEPSGNRVGRNPGLSVRSGVTTDDGEENAVQANEVRDGSRIELQGGIRRSSAEIMSAPPLQRPPDFAELRMRKEMEAPERDELPQAAGAIDAPQWPPAKAREQGPKSSPLTPQTLGIQFNGVTGPTETGAFPPDVMGDVGPSQFFLFVNGRMRTFDKATGVADGVINADPDVFFASVMTPAGTNQVTFTSDPNVRYDRLTARWLLTIIDVTLNRTTGATVVKNRCLIAVSDGPYVTAGTVWTFYWFQDPSNLFIDYPSLGVDANALYIGGNMFTLAGSFNSVRGYVVPKAPLLTASPASVFVFTLVTSASGAGPFAARGVDNLDPNNTGPTATGYFIGVDNASFSLLQLRRVTNPGAIGGSPTISVNISFSTSISTQFPVKVPHLGNTGGNAGRLDALDDRLYAAHLRNGRLWTAHNIGVNNVGATPSITSQRNRNAARWYEIQNLNGTPSVVQAGTLYNNTTTNDANQRSYWIPTIMVSGQGHAALGCSIAGTNERINAFTTGRLVGDALGTLREGAGLGALPAGYTSSSTAYNPASDPGGSGGRRWGDYSFTSLDPLDDMTMWTVQEYCNGTNTYGCQVVQLLAPPPATPSASTPASVFAGETSVNVTVTGLVVSGSGFYDPGANLAAPALPFNHISASVGGGVVVNSVTYNSPTSVTLNLNTTGASFGAQSITVTNPDGQSRTGAALLTINPPAPTLTVSPSTQQYSDPVTLVATVSKYACSPSGVPASDVTFYVGTQNVGTVDLVDEGTTMKATLTVPLLEPVPFGTSPTGQMAPGNRTVTAVFGGVNQGCVVPNATAALTIAPEDARATYTGASFASTSCASCNDATVTLSATIQDISATADAAGDDDAGDIRNAKVSFINRDNNSVIVANLPVGLVSAGDTKTGTVTYNWNVDIGNNNSATYNVGVVVSNYYARNNTNDDALVTVSKPLDDFITGGGHLILSNSSGLVPGEPGSKNNFGFNLKYNKSGRNLQGSVNIMVRNSGRVYKIKGTAFTSLSVNSTTHAAIFNSKANIQDVTDPQNPISIDGNASLQLTMVDNGEPGSTDVIGITLWNKSGGMWFSSNWDGVRTVEQELAGGNLSVRGGSVAKEAAGDIIPTEYALFQNYPNPFNPSTQVRFDLPEQSRVRVVLYDVLGREVLTLIDGDLEAGRHVETWYGVDQRGVPLASGIYVMKFDAKSLTGERSLTSVKKMLLMK